MKDNYIRIHKKRFLHIALCLILFLLFPLTSLILFLVAGNKQIAFSSFFLCIFSGQVGYFLCEYRKWIDEKYGCN